MSDRPGADGPIVAVADPAGRPALDRLRIAVATAGLRQRILDVRIVGPEHGGAVDIDLGVPAVAGEAAEVFPADLVARRRRLMVALGWCPAEEGHLVGDGGVELDRGGPEARIGPPWQLPTLAPGLDVWSVVAGAGAVEVAGWQEALDAERDLDDHAAAAVAAAVRRWRRDGSLAARSAGLAALVRGTEDELRTAQRRLSATREELAERIVAHEALLTQPEVGRRRWRR